MTESLIDLLWNMGLTFGVGSSTFALIFYIQALGDGVIDDSEKRLMHTVYIVLRVGIALIVVSVLAGLLNAHSLVNGSVYKVWFLLCIIVANALLMWRHTMPMRFGPILAGGSWYALFIIAKTPLGFVDGWMAALLYAFFLSLFYAIFTLLKNHFLVNNSTFNGDTLNDIATLEHYATDASSFKVIPQAVYFPKNVNDIVVLIQMCLEERTRGGTASITLRAGGTCMSGGPLNSGWIVDMTKHMNRITIDPVGQTATVEMGAYFRDIEDEAKKYGLMFAAYPSSHRICGIGGMIGNNASGEKSLRCGATSDNVLSLDVVLADGTLEHMKEKKISDITLPREKILYALYKRFAIQLTRATGNVKKSASGYRLEKLVHDDMFNPVPLFVGAQGTLGIVTKAVLKLTPIPAHTELLVISGQSLKDIPGIIETIFTYNPEGIETFDRNTFAKAREFLASQVASALPYLDEHAHLFILAQFSEPTHEATVSMATKCLSALIGRGYFVKHVIHPPDVRALWEIRRNAFLLMRDHNAEGFKAVPCIEDVIVPISALDTFVTELRNILQRRKITYGYHGHIGDGSLRIIPVFDFRLPTVSNDITTLMEEVFALVKRLKGNMSADHSDGIVRSPFIKEFYGEELYGAFESIKQVYDPKNIMNPNKKIGGSVTLLNRCLDC